ncbi:MAG: hypothetical protein P4M12_03830 [Gammaproteobacteria bacterium]|nr:hypothetical protein [Gammaproteobacteria bacterium]
MKLLLSATPVSLWQEVIHEAESTCHVALQEELEAYLVLLLVRYTTKPELAQNLMAPKFLQALECNRKERELALQDVGDNCLLLSGFFPGIAEKRLVKISYFTNIGRTAYATISHKSDDLFCALSDQFIAMMDVLQSVRMYSDQHTDLLPLQAYELWNETGSQRALKALKQYTQATPFNVRSFR